MSKDEAKIERKMTSKFVTWMMLDCFDIHRQNSLQPTSAEFIAKIFVVH